MSRSVELPDGARIAYADSGGAALPVVFLHAFPVHSAMWAPQVEALAGRHRCITFDVRGFGGSSAGSLPLTIDRMADDLGALLDALAIERAVLVGLSMGGYAALAALRRHRDRIAALLLADTRAAADSDEARAKRATLIALAREEGSEAVAAKQVVGLLGKTTRRRDPELVERVERMMAEASPAAIVAGAEALRDRPDATPLLPSIDVPVLLLCGEEDVITPADEMRAVADAIPGARLELLPEAGHLSNLENPAAFTEALRRFLASI